MPPELQPGCSNLLLPLLTEDRPEEEGAVAFALEEQQQQEQQEQKARRRSLVEEEQDAPGGYTRSQLQGVVLLRLLQAAHRSRRPLPAHDAHALAALCEAQLAGLPRPLLSKALAALPAVVRRLDVQPGGRAVAARLRRLALLALQAGVDRMTTAEAPSLAAAAAAPAASEHSRAALAERAGGGAALQAWELSHWLHALAEFTSSGSARQGGGNVVFDRASGFLAAAAAPAPTLAAPSEQEEQAVRPDRQQRSAQLFLAWQQQQMQQQQQGQQQQASLLQPHARALAVRLLRAAGGGPAGLETSQPADMLSIACSLARLGFGGEGGGAEAAPTATARLAPRCVVAVWAPWQGQRSPAPVRSVATTDLTKASPPPR